MVYGVTCPRSSPQCVTPLLLVCTFDKFAALFGTLKICLCTSITDIMRPFRPAH